MFISALLGYSSHFNRVVSSLEEEICTFLYPIYNDYRGSHFFFLFFFFAFFMNYRENIKLFSALNNYKHAGCCERWAWQKHTLNSTFWRQVFFSSSNVSQRPKCLLPQRQCRNIYIGNHFLLEESARTFCDYIYCCLNMTTDQSKLT